MKQEQALQRGVNDPGLANPSRRSLLVGSAGAMAAVSLLGFTPLARAEEPKSLPEFAAWKERTALIVHSANTMETQRGAIGNGVITASDRLFVRNNLPAPPASITENPDAWEVHIDGVKNPRTLTLGELKTMGVTTVASVLQCSGNGREIGRASCRERVEMWVIAVGVRA